MLQLRLVTVYVCVCECAWVKWRCTHAHSVYAVLECVFVHCAGLSKRSSSYPLLKVGDCVTLPSELSSEPSACHIWLQSVRAERGAPASESTRGSAGRRNKQREAVKEKMTEHEVVIWGVTPAPASFEALLLSLHSNRQEKQAQWRFHLWVFFQHTEVTGKLPLYLHLVSQIRTIKENVCLLFTIHNKCRLFHTYTQETHKCNSFYVSMDLSVPVATTELVTRKI